MSGLLVNIGPTLLQVVNERVKLGGELGKKLGLSVKLDIGQF
jgi:hypothetical protein